MFSRLCSVGFLVAGNVAHATPLTDCDPADAPAGKYLNSCQANRPAGSAVCELYGGPATYIFCDADYTLTATQGAEIFAVTDYAGTSDVVHSIWGTNGQGFDFCCRYEETTDTLSDFILEGTNLADELYLSISDTQFLYAYGNMNTSVFGLNSEDFIAGSNETNVNDSENLLGGNHNDTILGYAGNDYISGDGGADIINSGAGADYVEGGDGDDTILLGYGNDTAFGGENDDLIDGGHGDDEIHGDAGVDGVQGGYGVDELWGGDGDDHVCSGPGTGDAINGGNVGGGNVLPQTDRLWAHPSAVSPTGIAMPGSFCGDRAVHLPWHAACSFSLFVRPSLCTF